MDADWFSPLFLSRVQFGFVISFHILFPAFTIGLASWLAFLEFRWLRTREDLWRDLYFFWLKIFAISFGMGVVSGIVMSFQFGTNWAVLSERAGNILGPLLSYEVLTAFFLEATFLGVMLFGWRKVSDRLHFFATCMVALGTLLSTFWIISANSWMQTPQGFSIDARGWFVPEDWWAIVFNPSFPYRLAHMVLAAFITTCLVIGGVSAWYLRRDVHVAPQVPGTDAADHQASRNERGQHHVRQPVRERRVEHDRPPVLGHEPAARVDAEALRRLHPAVGGDDPEGRQQGAQRDHAGGEEVQAVGDLAPAEQHHPEEGRLEEERGQHFVTQQRPEDVAGALAQHRPVGAELETHDDAADHAHAERDREDLEPEEVEVAPEVFARAQPAEFQECQPARQADGEGREQDVERDHEAELDP